MDQMRYNVSVVIIQIKTKNVSFTVMKKLDTVLALNYTLHVHLSFNVSHIQEYVMATRIAYLEKMNIVQLSLKERKIIV